MKRGGGVKMVKLYGSPIEEFFVPPSNSDSIELCNRWNYQGTP